MKSNIIVILIVVVIIGAIVFYLVKQKKKGATCIGCPYSKKCSGHCGDCYEFSRDDKKHL